MEEITELRSNGQNTHAKWRKAKEDIKENAIKITEEERRKANRLIKGLKRDMGTQRISSNNATTENRMRAREEFLFLKSSLNKIGKKKLETAKESAQA